MSMPKIIAGAVAALLLATAARAEEAITLSCTATTDCASAFAAADHGFFAAHGLAVTITPIALNSNIPAALTSESIQIGGPTPSVLLQAVDGGLDLVVLATASVTNRSTADGAAGVEEHPGRLVGPGNLQGATRLVGGVMRGQNMLRGDIDTAHLIAP